MCVKNTLSNAARFLAGGSESAQLAVFLHGFGDPLQVGFMSDGLVHRVDHDHFEELVRTVLAHPVTVQNPQRSTLAARTFLNNIFVR